MLKRPASPLKFWILLTYLALATNPSQASTYYVSPTGSDSNPGTSAKPWQTLTKVNHTRFEPGDKILLLAGAAFTGNLYFGASDLGSAASPITVSTYGQGKATIEAGAGYGIMIHDTGGIAVSNLNVLGGWSASTASINRSSGICASNDLGGDKQFPYLRIKNCSVSGFCIGGIVLQDNAANGSKCGFSDVVIDRCVCHGNGSAGIVTFSPYPPSTTSTDYSFSNVSVTNCSTYDNQGIKNFNGMTGNGIELEDVNGGLIDRCVAHDNGALNFLAAAGPVGIWFWDSNKCIISHCESYNNHSGNCHYDGDGFDFDGGSTNCVMEYNYSHGNDGAGFLLAQPDGRRVFFNDTIRYNISENDGRVNAYGGITLWNGGSGLNDCHIYNNTVYMSQPAGISDAGIQFYSAVNNVDVRNNIFVGLNGAASVNVTPDQSKVVFQDNDYWQGTPGPTIDWEGTTFNSLAAWQDATGEERLGSTPTGFDIDPMLASPGNGGTIGDINSLATLTAYKLMPSSRLIGAGIDLTNSPYYLSVGPTNFFGVSIPQASGYDIGAG